MTQIATITQQQVVAVEVLPMPPKASPGLAGTIGVMERGVTPHPIAPTLGQEARDHLVALAPLLRPSVPVELLAWLAKLRHTVRGAPEGWQAILAKAEGIWEDCQDLPRGVWCDATRRDWRSVQPRGNFWPLPGELAVVLRAYGDRMKREAYGCRKLLNAIAARDAEVPRAIPTPEERSAVRALVQSLRMERHDEDRDYDSGPPLRQSMNLARAQGDEHVAR